MRDYYRKLLEKGSMAAIKKIDGKWVKMTQEDMLKTSSNRTTTKQCTKAINALYDAKARSEVAAVLHKHGE